MLRLQRWWRWRWRQRRPNLLCHPFRWDNQQSKINSDYTPPKCVVCACVVYKHTHYTTCVCVYVAMIILVEVNDKLKTPNGNTIKSNQYDSVCVCVECGLFFEPTTHTNTHILTWYSPLNLCLLCAFWTFI